MRLVMVGISHETASIRLRERLSFSAAECEPLIKRLVAETGLREALILCTCNRTELYARPGTESADLLEESKTLVRWLIRTARVKNAPAAAFYSRTGEDAVRALYRVACGLESMVKGEAQILAQVKDAYRAACAAGTCGAMFHKLFHSAFRAGKRARTETAIGTGAVSVSLAAVELAEDVLGELCGKTILLVGAGKMAGGAAAHLCEQGASVVVVNRTGSKARELAGRCRGRAAPFGALEAAVAQCDALITSASVRRPLITREMIRRILPARNGRRLLVVDIGLPRNVEPGVERLKGVSLYNIDDMKDLVDRSLALRQREVAKVEKIIEREIAAFEREAAALELAPAIRNALDAAEAVRRDEIRRFARHFSAEQLKHVETLTRNIARKILHRPIHDLTDAGGRGEGEEP